MQIGTNIVLERVSKSDKKRSRSRNKLKNKKRTKINRESDDLLLVQDIKSKQIAMNGYLQNIKAKIQNIERKSVSYENEIMHVFEQLFQALKEKKLTVIQKLHERDLNRIHSFQQQIQITKKYQISLAKYYENIVYNGKTPMKYGIKQKIANQLLLINVEEMLEENNVQNIMNDETSNLSIDAEKVLQFIENIDETEMEAGAMTADYGQNGSSAVDVQLDAVQVN